MFLGNNLLGNILATNVTKIQEKLESIAPSIADDIIESSKGEIVNSIQSNNIQYLYSFGKYNIIVDYNNDVFIDEDITVIDLTSSIEY